MSKTEAELIGDGLSSIAQSIAGLNKAVLLLAASVETFPLRYRMASGLTSTEAQQRLDMAIAEVRKSL